MIVRCGSGLGDSLYLRPLAEHLIARGEKVAVASNYPDVFIGTGATVEPFRRERVDLVAHYVNGKDNPQTTLWQDMLAFAKIAAPVPLRFNWEIKNRSLVKGIRKKAAGRPVVVVHGGREPMGRRDRFGIELMPTRDGFCTVLSALADCYTVRVGAGNEMYDLPSTLNMSNLTSISELLDIARDCDGIVAQCSFAIPMAEAFDKPLLAVWSARGLVSPTQFIRTVTPSKILSKPSSSYVMDDAGTEEIRTAAYAWRARHLLRDAA